MLLMQNSLILLRTTSGLNVAPLFLSIPFSFACKKQLYVYFRNHLFKYNLLNHRFDMPWGICLLYMQLLLCLIYALKHIWTFWSNKVIITAVNNVNQQGIGINWSQTWYITCLEEYITYFKHRFCAIYHLQSSKAEHPGWI